MLLDEVLKESPNSDCGSIALRISAGVPESARFLTFGGYMESHSVEEPASLADKVDCRCLVDVWIGSLNHPHPNVPACEVLLSAEERARAARYRFDHIRGRLSCAAGPICAAS
jgi:hypothetical protein